MIQKKNVLNAISTLPEFFTKKELKKAIKNQLNTKPNRTVEEIELKIQLEGKVI